MWREIGARIKNIRADNNLTQAQFGELIGISGQQVGRIERGTRTISVTLIAEICKQMRVSTDYIIFGFTNPITNFGELRELSDDQIEIGFDILKRFAEFINTDNGNEILMHEVVRRQFQKM